ncbi:MAG: HAD hydrolase family protein, partial [Firmicutes bacterium]|nr:HAD hydrolase family protein [Bacillota bacterium]
DIYDEGYWYLEVSAGGASKAAAVQWLKEYGGFDELVVFGDNMNDLSMFAAADRAYAVANAVPAVKEKADRVIGANVDCGVPAFIEEELRRETDGTV